ncbi:hypothetical protein Glove_185g54 [Diversispora epigaea]|uniref:Transposase Tc1-like domain-containing protein n=1 Tax=Diversispora epigaea TaxID=1348612 RepID=A0A397IW49_9GLOM|nr:hypothetical protein Glove_185g54 [Diversispora epigaea]
MQLTDEERTRAITLLEEGYSSKENRKCCTLNLLIKIKEKTRNTENKIVINGSQEKWIDSKSKVKKPLLSKTRRQKHLEFAKRYKDWTM